MKDKTYNLQVPIDLDLAETLKKLAKEDDRNLRAYCKRVLQDHVKNSEQKIQTLNNNTETSVDVKHHVDDNEEEKLKNAASKVKGFKR